MPRGIMTIEQILTALAEGPPRIAEATSGLTMTQLHTAPGAGEWSANEVLAHLRACADIWGACIATMLEQDQPTIRAMNPRTWIERTDYPDQEFHSSLKAFMKQRGALLVILQSLSPKAWSRSAIVTGAGKPIVRTVQSYAEWLAEHERPHVKQIKRMVTMMRK